MTIWTYTKRGNLLPYLHSKNCTPSERTREYYGAERELQLILFIRNENGKIYCRIKCPVSPLPVKGEFEVPSIGAINNFLYQNGWTRRQTIPSHMFN